MSASDERLATALGVIRHYAREDYGAAFAAVGPAPDVLALIAAGQYLALELAAHLDTDTDDVLDDLIRTLLTAPEDR